MGIFRRLNPFPKTSQLISNLNFSDSETLISEFDDIGRLIAKEVMILTPFLSVGLLQHDFPVPPLKW